MILVRADARYVSSQPGIESWHCFSAGAHYDESNVAFGAVVGVDEHLLDVGAGFSDHAHAGVEIISWVASGVLHHVSGSTDVLVNAGESLVQDAADGLRHAESNGSPSEPLRLIQTTLLAGSGSVFSVLHSAGEVEASWVHLFVVDGSWVVDSVDLSAGDSVRTSGPVSVTGAGSLLVVSG